MYAYFFCHVPVTMYVLDGVCFSPTQSDNNIA